MQQRDMIMQLGVELNKKLEEIKIIQGKPTGEFYAEPIKSL